MRQKHPLLPVLGLAFLFAGALACNPAPEQEEAATTDLEQTAPASPAAATDGPAAGGETPGGASAPGVPAAPDDNVPLSVADLPEVVAKVNGKPIQKQELVQAAQVVQLQLAQRGRPATPSKAFYRQVLEELITIALLQQDAQAQGVTASEQEVQRHLDARKSVYASEEAFAKALAQSGITENTLRQQTRDQLAVQRYVETELAGDIEISDQATREFYERNKGKIRSPERRHLRHILVAATARTPPADKQKARQKADGLLARLQAGEDFAQLAMGSSDDNGSRLKGGDLGWVVKGQTVPQFETAAFALAKPNDMSGVVESPFGFHIVQLLERQPAGAVPYDQVKDRIAAMLKERQTQQQVRARVRDLRAQGKVEVFL